MSEIEDLERAIAALENQRSQLGDRTVDTALAPLREKLQILKARHSPPEQQLKYVSVLFTDIVDSTRMGQQLDPEDIMEIVDGALQRYDQIIRQHGGRVTRFMGDGLKAVFGLPATSEDDAERAVKAGLALVEATQEYARHVEKNWQLSGFNIRLGINTGQILVGGGVEDKNTAMGMAINLAARMETAAPVGGVLISDTTYHHVRGRFEVIAQPPIQVKGLEQPIQTYCVVGARPRPFHTTGRGVQGVSTVLIGREAELAKLQEACRAIMDESPRAQIVTILGQAGVGKSRLLAEFEAWLEQRPQKINCYKGRATPQTLASPYSLLRELLTTAFNIDESDPAEQTRARLESGLARFLDDEAEMKVHFIGALLGYDYNESPHLRGVISDPKQINQRGLFYLDQCLKNVAGEAPTVVLLEDIHWADDPSLQFILQILSSLRDFPLLVICLARRILLENHPEWPVEDPVQGADCLRLVLEPLSEIQSRQLVQTILTHVEHVPESLQDLIVQQAEGNPYYIEELINVLIDDGIIQILDSESIWSIDSSRIDEVRIPPTLNAVLQTRLDGLSIPEKNVLQGASVIGRIFWEQPLNYMLSYQTPPDSALYALTDRRLIQPNASSTFPDVNEFAFRQSLMRDVTYKTVLKRDRQRFHANVAAWLADASQSSGRIDEFLSQIGEHYDRAGDQDQAAEWYLRAGERAKVQGALLQARLFYDRTLDLLPDGDRERRWRSLLGRDEILGLLGETTARQADDQALLDLANAEGDDRWLAEAYYRMGYSASQRGDERTAIEAYQAAISAASREGDKQIQAEILALSAISYTRLGDLESAEGAVESALELAQKISDDETLAKVFTNIAAHYSEVGNLSRAVELIQEQIKTTQRLGHRVGEAIGLSNLGYGYTQLGKYSASERALNESLKINQAIGARHNYAFGQLNLGLVYWRTGRFALADDVLKQALKCLRDIGDQFGHAAGLVYLALNQEASKDVSGARDNFSRAREQLVAINMTALESDAIAGLSRCALSGGQPELAHQLTKQLWEFLQESHGQGMEFPILAFLTCADVFLTLGDDLESRNVVQLGRQVLFTRADKISNPHWRSSFLEKVPEHAEIINRWEQ